jgi:hypothetical protein
VGTIWWPFATMLERADTEEAIGLNRSRLRSTRPVYLLGGIALRLSEYSNLTLNKQRCFL